MIDYSETTRWEPSSLSTSISGSSLRDRLKNRSSLLVAATGVGKTVMMSSIANHWPMGRVLVLSHRFELNQQAIKQFEHWCGEPVDLEQSTYKADQYGQRHRIVVASVQTLNTKVRSRRDPLRGKYRMEKFDPHDFGLVLCDEAHHITASTFLRVIEYFSRNPAMRLVGVTATPDRLDKVGLGNIFGHVACDYNIKWAIENGWLVEPKQKFVQIDGLDLTSVRTVAGDLDQKQLSRLVEMEDNLHAMAKPIVDVAGEHKQCIVFTSSVAQAHRMAELIRDYCNRRFGCGDPNRAVSIDGKMSPQDPRRRAIVDEFRRGAIQYLVNCGVATEGFDAPNVSLIAIGRPTKSRALYTQMVGRAARPLTGVVDGLLTPAERLAAIAASDKPDCTILDFVGQSGRHKLICTTDILAADDEEPEIISAAKSIQLRKDFDGTSLDAILEARRQAEAAREAARAKVTVDVLYQLHDAESVYDMSVIPNVPCPGYLKANPPTEKQQKMLYKLGYTTAQVETMNPRKASAAIDYAIKNPRTGFGRWLKQQKAPKRTR